MTGDETGIAFGGAASVAFLGIAAGVQMSDRGVAALLSPAIETSFAVSDAWIGALHGIAGILVASALAVQLAHLADRHSRKMILIALIVGWPVLTVIGALPPNFPLFFIGRAASGVTEFAMIPIVYSLIPDLVGDRWRVIGNLSFAALMAVGASGGFYLGGQLLAGVTPIAHDLGVDPWRLTMLAVGVLGVPLAIGALFTRDPPRRSLIDAPSSGRSLLTFVREDFRPVLLFVGAAGGLAVAVQAVMPMAPMALQRRYATDLTAIGQALGSATLATSLASLVLAGLGDRLLVRYFGARTRPLIMGAAAAMAIPCAWLLPGAASEPAAVLVLTCFLFATCVANALIPTMLQDIAPPDLRARAFAGYSFLIAAFCALGPVLSGSVSDHLLAGDLLSAIAGVSVAALAVAAVCATLAGWHNK